MLGSKTISGSGGLSIRLHIINQALLSIVSIAHLRIISSLRRLIRVWLISRSIDRGEAQSKAKRKSATKQNY
jgi:hypothetical protein